MSHPLPPPGWYPDPDGKGGRRYWDGTKWAPPVEPKKKRTWPLVLGVSVVVIPLMFLMFGGTKQEKADDSRTTTRATADSAMPTRAIPPTPKVTAEQLDRTSYRDISQRDFLMLLKDPDAHYGERIIVYGEVKQFDSVTGSSGFRSSLMGQPYNPPGENSLITAADPSILANVVEGDDLTMYVEVEGTTTYQSQIGGQLTVPVFNAYVVEPFKARP